MPRKRKKKGQAQAQAQAKVRDHHVATFWSELIRRAQDAKKDYVATAKKVQKYLGGDHGSLYEDPEIQAKFMSFEGATAVSVPKIAQMRNTLGPRLYQTKPHRTITPTTDDGVMLGLARVLEEYLNYTVRETKFKKQLRKCVDDAMIRGRGILAQDIEPTRGVVTSRYVSSLDFVFDPDFHDVEDAKWIAFQVTEPLWETKRRITEKWRLKNLGRNVETTTHKTKKSGGDDDKESISAEQLSYWVVLSKMGAGFRGMGDKAPARARDDKDFVRLEIVLDHEVPLAEGQWDVPFYLDKDWPISVLDLIDPVDCGWPDSIGGQVLGSQEAIDLLSSLRLSSCKQRDRVVVFGNKELLDKTSATTLRGGTSADFIPIDVPQGRSLQDCMQIADFGQGSQESLVERQFHTQQIEVTTGVTDVLHGGQEADAKERSATASRLRSDAANARVADLRDRSEGVHTDAARKEAVITRLLVDAEDVAKVVRVSKIQMFYVKVEVPGQAEIATRDIRPREEREAQPMPDVLTMEQISPQASDFFLSPEEAHAAAQGVLQDLLLAEDPRVISLAASLQLDQIDPELGLPPSISVGVVTAEKVWEATAGITAEELMAEFSYELATGSGHQLNREALQDNADFLVQTVMPAALAVLQATGDPSALNTILKIREDAYEVSPEQSFEFAPIQPPSPPGGGGNKPPQGEGGE